MQTGAQTKVQTGAQSLSFVNAPFLSCAASVTGKKEGEGPLGRLFDHVSGDDLFGENTWEAAESAMQKLACSLTLQKAGREGFGDPVSVRRGSSPAGYGNLAGSRRI